MKENLMLKQSLSLPVFQKSRLRVRAVPWPFCYECINLKKKTAEVEESYCSSCFLNTIEFNLLKAAECATAFQPFEWLVSLWHLIEVMMLLNFYYAVILIIFTSQNIEKRFR